MNTIILTTILLLSIPVFLWYYSRKYSNELKRLNGVITELEELNKTISSALVPKAKAFESEVDLMTSFLRNEYIELLNKVRLFKKNMQGAEWQSISKDVYTPIEVLQLSTRTTNALIKNGIGSIQILKDMSVEDLYELRGLGITGVEEIKKVLSERNLSLANEKNE